MNEYELTDSALEQVRGGCHGGVVGIPVGGSFGYGFGGSVVEVGFGGGFGFGSGGVVGIPVGGVVGVPVGGCPVGIPVTGTGTGTGTGNCTGLVNLSLGGSGIHLI